MANCVKEVVLENPVLQETLNRSAVLQDALRRSRSYLGQGCSRYGNGLYRSYAGYGPGYGGYPYGSYAGYGGYGCGGLTASTVPVNTTVPVCATTVLPRVCAPAPKVEVCTTDTVAETLRRS